MSWPGGVHGSEEEAEALHARVQGGGRLCPTTNFFARGEISAKRWTILEAAVCDEDAKTIAEELTLSEAAVRGRLERMRKKFCDLVEERALSHRRSRQEEREVSERSDAAAA